MKVRRQRAIKVLERAVQIQKALDKITPLYKEMEEILGTLKLSQQTEWKHGKWRIKLVDNFKSRNLMWKATPFRRWDLEIEKEKKK